MQKLDALLALGFQSDEEPSEQAIKKAYRASALKYHPDKLSFPKGASKAKRDAIQAKHKRRFEKIATAYDCLTNPTKKEYNQDSGERGPMTPHEYMSWQHGYSYTSQFCRIYGDKSQKYNIAFDCYRLDSDQKIEMESQKSDYFYFDTVEQLKPFCCFLMHKGSYKISLTSDKIPSESSKLLVDALLKNFHIKQVKIEGDFLVPEQQQRLDEFLYKRNYPERLQKSRMQVLETLVGSSSKSGALLGSLLVYYSYGIGFLSAFTGYYVGTALGNLRNKYLDYAVDECFFFYDKRDYTKDSELEALKIGANAKSWLGYFSSYTRYASNRHPLYFAAGLKIALDEDEKALPVLTM